MNNSNENPVVIKSIECINRHRNEEDNGYSIKTSNGGYIRVLIDRMQQCCETFGVYAMKDKKNMKKNLKEFVGKEIVNIVVSPGKVQQDSDDENQEENEDENQEENNDEDDDDEENDEDDDDNGYGDQTRWVEIYLKDDPIPLMLYLYNQHNGYYTHGCTIEWKGQVIPDENISFSL